MNELPISDIRDALVLSENGALLWRKRPSRSQEVVGSEAGYERPDGYRIIKIKGVRLLAHRVVFALLHARWPKEILDHIDGNPRNNRPSNLREATPAENGRNVRRNQQNTSGRKGVSWSPTQHRWRASIKSGDRQFHLGYFADLEQAAQAYASAAHRLHGEFASPAYIEEARA